MSKKHPISPLKNPPDSKRPNSSLGTQVITRGATAINIPSTIRTFDSMTLKPIEKFDGSQFPTNAQVLERIFYEKDFSDPLMNRPTKDVIADIYPEIESIYAKLPCPMKRKDKCLEKMLKLYEKWQKLSKNVNTLKNLSDSSKESFKKELASLCDFSAQDALEKISTDRGRTQAQKNEDIQFMKDQNTDRKGKFLPEIDKSFVKKQERKEIRNQEVVNALRTPTISTISSSSQSLRLSDSESSSEEDNDKDSDFKAPDTREARRSRSRGPNLSSNRKMMASLDRAGLSLRDSTRVVGSTLEANGVDLQKSTFSKSTLGRQRSKSRAEIGKQINHIYLYLNNIKIVILFS